MQIKAYFEEWSRQPGETVRMAVSAPGKMVRARFMRLVSGPGKGELDAGVVTDMPQVLDRSFAITPKTTAVGSHAVLPLPQPVEADTLAVHCWIFPTATGAAAQTVWALGKLSLAIRNGAIGLERSGRTIASIPDAIKPGHWYSVAAILADGQASLDLKRMDAKINARRHVSAAGGGVAVTASTLVLASSGVDETGSPRNAYDGKIDSPTIHLRRLGEADLLAAHDGRAITSPWASWLIGQDFASSSVAPAWAGGKPGRIHNGGERGVTGRNWNGRSDSFGEVPAQYCALQFHSDDMVDSGWAYELEFELPVDLKSGVYLVRLESVLISAGS